MPQPLGAQRLSTAQGRMRRPWQNRLRHSRDDLLQLSKGTRHPNALMAQDTHIHSFVCSCLGTSRSQLFSTRPSPSHLLAMAAYMVYRTEAAENVYFGAASNDLADRCATMRLRPVLWLRGCRGLQKATLELQLGRRVSLQVCSALEAAMTATAWLEQPHRVRGGPWCLRRLSKEMGEELAEVAAAVKSVRSYHQQFLAVWAVAKKFSRQGALARHLRGICYRCGFKFRACACTAHRRSDAGFGQKRKSGTSASGHEKRKRRGWAATSDYKRHKWGRHVKEARRKDNARQTPRPSGVRRSRPRK